MDTFLVGCVYKINSESEICVKACRLVTYSLVCCNTQIYFILFNFIYEEVCCCWGNKCERW